MVEGGVRAGVLRVGDVEVVEPSADGREAAVGMGVKAVGSVAEIAALKGGEQVLLAVKPQVFGEVAGALRG